MGTGGMSANLYCDMSSIGNYPPGWALVFTMCQNGGGSVRASGMSHTLPVKPSKNQPPTSLGYKDALKLNPTLARFGSDFGNSYDSGYIFKWDTLVKHENHMKDLLDGIPSNHRDTVSYSVGKPLPGSKGATCNMYWQDNNGGTESHDIATFGCGSTVWHSNGMKWGQIDSLSNYNGVSHLGSSNSWSHSAQTSNGCIHAYVHSMVFSEVLGYSAANPASSCAAVLGANPIAASGYYYITVAGATEQLYCDQTTTDTKGNRGGGWALIYSMCQNGGGSVKQGSITHKLPIKPDKKQAPNSVSYSDVSSMVNSDTVVRFSSDFGESPGYLFKWSSVTKGVNHMKDLLDGVPSSHSSSVSYSVGSPLSGSSGATCNMYMQDNNNGGETHDIPTFGCGSTVWGSNGMKWGQIDGLGNYNGVSHLGSSNSWSHSPQTSDGCIHVYVQ
jgi:hypothetical protein